MLSADDTEGDAEKSEEISAFKYSQDYVFSTVSIGHTFLDMLRDFNASKGSGQKPTGFFGSSEHRSNRDTFLQYLNILVQNVSSLFECEEKLTKINSPAFVIGDLRGNIDDVASMEQILWKEVPVVANNFVFLGNYVNEGKWGVEVVLYLFALKIIAPNKFFLVRGSNEVRSAQTAKNGFQQECMNKYGNKVRFHFFADFPFHNLLTIIIINDVSFSTVKQFTMLSIPSLTECA